MIYTKIHYDQLSDTTAIERVQDCNHIVRQAQGLAAIGEVGGKEMRHAARFPLVVVERYMNDAGIDMQEFMRDPVHVKRMLADDALKAFRIWNGRVN